MAARWEHWPRDTVLGSTETSVIEAHLLKLRARDEVPADEERDKQEFLERQRRRSETAITNRPEQLMDSYFNRRSFDAYDRR